MIMGDTCTRACAFCDVKTGKPAKLDNLEPIKISQAVKKLNLKHVVITSVDRDDLDDGGSNHFFEVINQTRKTNPNTTIEVLTPDFLRKGNVTGHDLIRWSKMTLDEIKSEFFHL